MLLECKIVYRGGQGEIVEKKSRFIATVRPVSNEEEALAFIEEMRKKYWDARHNCFARFSDDGEPGGTAGKPMLDVLLGEELHNVAVVVTRYFGGTLLGTGGLVRAYSKAVKAGLMESIIGVRTVGVKLTIGMDYTLLGKVQYILGERRIPILDSAYTDKAEIFCLVPAGGLADLKADLIEGTSGKALLTEGEACHFAEIEGDIKILES